LQSIDNFTLIGATCRPCGAKKPQNQPLRYLNTGALSFTQCCWLQYWRWPTSPPPTSLSLAACTKVLPVLTSTRVLVKVLGRVPSRKLLVRGSPSYGSY